MQSGETNLAVHPTRARALELMLEGRSDREIAKELGVSPSTVWRWRCDPAFDVELRTAQRDRVVVMGDRMNALAFRALDVIASILDDEEAAPMLRMRAAETALDRAGWSADGKERRSARVIEAEIDGLLRVLGQKLPAEMLDAVIAALNEPIPEPEKPEPRRPRVVVSYDDPVDLDSPLEDRIAMAEGVVSALKSQRRKP